MSQIIKKGLSDNAVDGSKIKLANNEALKARNAADDGDIDLIKADGTDQTLINSAVGNIRMQASGTGKSAFVFGDNLIDLTAGGDGTNISVFGTKLIATTSNAIDLAGIDNQTLLKFYEFSGGFDQYVGLRAPTDVTASYTITLPGSAPSAGQILKSDGSGNLTWQADAAGSTEVFEKVTVTLSAGDITNQYYDLAHVAKTNSIMFIVKGLGPTLEGATHDYSVSYTGGVGSNTRITFLNDLATGGSSALIAGDIVQIMYVR